MFRYIFCSFDNILDFMQKFIFTLFFHAVFIRALWSSSSDSLMFSNHVFNERIKTVQLYKEGWNLSYPVLKINTDEKLVLHFDLLGNNIETYYYTFIHCTKDWEKSDIFPDDYMEGVPENQLEEFKSSFNTTVNYIHYKLTFPNNRIRFKISGNYILYVYPVNESTKPVLTQRFVITENAVKINPDAHRPLMTANNNSSQQIDFTVAFSGMIINDPYRNIYAFILQNGRWDNSRRNLKPDFLGNNELKYNSLSDKNIFSGGNEYRYFDIKSIRHQTEYVKRIDYLIPNYHVYLFPSENREFKPYFYWQDFNGKYYIAIQEGKVPETDADYVYVYFTLPSKYIADGGKMYVSGALANWTLNKDNLMVYNYEKAEYECTMLLKQGWYNYEYLFQKDGSLDNIPTKYEGSHYETENDYLILIYYRNPRQRYDRVIGTTITNTLNRLTN
jgi:hypothetical protein